MDIAAKISQARHEEVRSDLKKVASALSSIPKPDNSAIIAVLNSIKEQLTEVPNQPISITPNVTVNNESLSNDLKELSNGICAKLDQVINILTKQPEEKKSWEFSITRNYHGFIETISAKPKL